LSKLNAVGDPQTLATLKVNPNDLTAGLKAANEYSKAYNVPLPQAITQLQAIQKLPPSDLAFLNAHGTQLQSAQSAAPREWRTWWWVCVGTEAAFIPFIFVMAGRWSPRRAKRDEQEHQRRVDRELAALQTSGGVTPTAQA